nr:DNA polymerase epsilon catalytic subunit A [Crypthecodinium cohnii]
MAGRGGGAYVNGRYVANAGRKGGGRGGTERNGRVTGWNENVGGASGGGGGPEKTWERKPGDEEVSLERKFDIDILQPGESRIGYLYNMKISRHYDEGGRMLSGLVLYFLQRDGRGFRCTFLYRPYFFVQLDARENLESMRDILEQRFESEGCHAEIVEKEDLSMEDHIIGRKRKLIRLDFNNTEGHGKAVRNLMGELRRSQAQDLLNQDEDDEEKKPKGGRGSAMERLQALYEYDVDYINRTCIDNGINCGKWFKAERNKMATSADNLTDTQCQITHQKEMVMKPGLRIFAWDIECTKEPLKFPDSAHDRITLISIMVDGSGFLIVNRQEVSEDIEPLEYTPTPEYEGIFQTFNEPDEAGLLRRFFRLMQETNPQVLVSFNGDFFDFPFVTARAKVHGLDWNEECGVRKADTGDFYVGNWMVHLDCFAWVQRDSYLPCGARGLKAVTRYKLKYDPVELDPEDMTPFAKERPQELAAYSVSDAVATYYLYMKYIHDFIFALCTIIPYNPDDVLRKGSGTLCESLLMNQAFQASVLFPNKHIDPALEFHEATNRMIEQSTYEGARVECMRVGAYRADIKETFELEPSAFQILINDLKATVDFYLEVEEKVKLEDVENYEEILAAIEKTLRDLCDPDKAAAQVGRLSHASSLKSQATQEEEEYNMRLVEYEVVEGSAGVKQGGKKVKKSSYRVVKDDFPLIYHLDVGAMYPNIILSNRLQPPAVVTQDFCNSCSYNDPSNQCKRVMDWKWRGELYMATRADVKSIMNEMESDNRRYNQKDRDTGEVKRVPWKELREKERTAEINKAVRDFSQRAYRRVKSSIYEDKRDIVCQRENSFYVDTVRMFRDRRYEFKALTKKWNKNLEKAEESGDLMKKMEAKDMVLLYDSLQLAHKCILNSFYGYVMRKGARWHSMKMAGIVTYTGSNLIREAREFCDMVGLPLELDTDGIWCLLPKSFPDTFKFKLKNGKDLKMPYANCVLNYRVHQKYTNHQYQGRDEKTGEWKTSSENSIFFEIDGPYKAMILPASTEEDKMLKKRYAVFNFDGSIAELKGFEVKRRGELRLIQVFQTEVFPEFLKGCSKEEVYQIVGSMANRWLDVIESKGKTMSDEEVIYFFSESKSMSKSVEASGNSKSVQITCARRLAEFLGADSYLTASGLSCHMFIAAKPSNASTTERAVPVKIFFAEHEVKKRWLQKWLQDTSLTDFDMRSIIDWNYYKDRLCAVFQKLISIPAAYQKISNPCPRVPIPEWLRKRVAEQNDKYQQTSLGLWFRKAEKKDSEEPTKRKLGDMEDLAGGGKNLPPVEFGAAQKRFLDAQRSRVAQQASAIRPTRDRNAVSVGYSGSFGNVWAETLSSTWHIVAIEPMSNLRASSEFRVGDVVLAALGGGGFDVPETADTAMEDDDVVDIRRGTISGFVGGLIRVRLANSEERLLPQTSVKALGDEGLFAVWIAVDGTSAVQRIELSVKRRVVLGLDAAFDTSVARCEVRPSDLVKGLQVWPRVESANRVGPGSVVQAFPELGICNVSWATNNSEVVFFNELDKQTGTALKVQMEPPRNMQHACLVQLTIAEDEFQQQCGEGTLGEGDTTWPRIDAIYESEQPLLFDVLSRLGSNARLLQTASVLGEGPSKNRGAPRVTLDDIESTPHTDYLLGLDPNRNAYLHLWYDIFKPQRCFCGIFAPSLGEAWICLNGIPEAHGEALRADLEQSLSEQLSKFSSGLLVRVEATFQNHKKLTGVLKWVDQKLLDLRRRDGCTVCVVDTQLKLAEMRGLTSSVLVDKQPLRTVKALREIPVCVAPVRETDNHFPLLDWAPFMAKKFGSKPQELFMWWRQRLSISRAAGLPVCNAPGNLMETIPAALDVLFARQLHNDNQLRWASKTSRPDLGEAALTMVDSQEHSLAAVDFTLSGKDLAAGKGAGQVNHPGMYRSICLELNLRTKLCLCALLHARYLSDRDGGELSKKVGKKGPGADHYQTADHSSEVSLGSFKSLVAMTQQLAQGCEAKEREIISLRTSWVAQSTAAKAAVIEAGLQLEHVGTAADDITLKEALEQVGLGDEFLAQRLDELRAEHEARMGLLDGIYGWLASESSLMCDPALLRKVQQYMDRALQLLLKVMKKSGCTIVHASYTKIILATGKYNVMPDMHTFWQNLSASIMAVKALEPLALDRDTDEVLAALHYGMMWMDPANYCVIPIQVDTGVIIWKAEHKWKLVELLPPGVRKDLEDFATELLREPQRELSKRHDAKGIEGDEAEPMEVEEAEGCEVKDTDSENENENEAKEEDTDDEKCEKCEKPAAAAEKGNGEAGVAAPKAAGLEDVREFIQENLFLSLRVKILKFLEEMQTQKLREQPGPGQESRAAEEDEEDEDEDREGRESEESDEEGETKEQRLRRKAEERQRRWDEKWSFPKIAGRKVAPGTVELEFMKALVQIFQLDDALTEHLPLLRDRMCDKLRMSSFGQQTRNFENPCFPLVLRDVVCQGCHVASHIDVTSHPRKAPGLWMCTNCETNYDKDVMQALLVGLLDSFIQAWQAQQITCKKCKSFRTVRLRNYCTCFGRFEARYSQESFLTIFTVLRSLVEPHDLPWLGQMLDYYEQLLG